MAKKISHVLDLPVEKIFLNDDSPSESASNKALSKLERLMLSNQYRILEQLNSNDDYEKRSFGRLAEIFEKGYVQMYRHALERIDEPFPVEASEEVLSILDMHRAMLFSLGEKPNPLDVERVRFKGFDANNEGDHLSFAKFWSDGGRKYSELQIFNSHHSTLSRYRKMLQEWNRMNRQIDLTRAQIESILEAGQLGPKNESAVQYYWGFRQTRLGSPADNVVNPGRAVLHGPYFSREEAEAARRIEASSWDSATSVVFAAESKHDAASQLEHLTPRQ
jgi:hypothetical protein